MTTFLRPSGRNANQLRPVSLSPGWAKYAEGSCLVKFGDTHVLCTASLEDTTLPVNHSRWKGIHLDCDHRATGTP